MIARHVFGPGHDDVVARHNAGGNVDWYVDDRLGSERAVFDNAGMVTNAIDYDAFGSFLGGVPVDRYGFAGREWDAALGLQYNRARMYDPSTGRWMGEDGIRQTAGDPNLYRYVGKGATNGVDPSGHEGWSILKPSEWRFMTRDEIRQEAAGFADVAGNVIGAVASAPVNIVAPETGRDLANAVSNEVKAAACAEVELAFAVADKGKELRQEVAKLEGDLEKWVNNQIKDVAEDAGQEAAKAANEAGKAIGKELADINLGGGGDWGDDPKPVWGEKTFQEIDKLFPHF